MVQVSSVGMRKRCKDRASLVQLDKLLEDLEQWYMRL